MPGVSKWYRAAGRRAGLYGPLPACCRVSHVHWRIPHHLQEPAAVTPPEVSGMAWHGLLVAGRSWTASVSPAQLPLSEDGVPDPSSMIREPDLLQGTSSYRWSLVSAT